MKHKKKQKMNCYILERASRSTQQNRNRSIEIRKGRLGQYKA